MRSLTVPAGTGPMRLDRFLTSHIHIKYVVDKGVTPTPAQ